MKLKRKNIKKNFKSSIVLLFSSLFFILGLEPQDNLSSLKENKEAVIYSAQCNDDLRNILASAIKKAKISIFTKIYQITDSVILASIIENMKKNDISVTIDCHTLKKDSPLYIKSDKLIKKINDKPKNKLMHMKILMIDDYQFWIGSANFTDVSLSKDSNLVVGFYSRDLAKGIRANESISFQVNGQPIDFKILPKDSLETLDYLLSKIDEAQTSIKIAMFAFSYRKIISALQKAQSKGVSVQVMIDKNYSKLMQKAIQETGSEFPVWVKASPYRLHHKFAWIDEQLLIFGSTNWTNNGFHKNDECMLFIHELSKKQNKKIRRIWNNLYLHKETLTEIISFPTTEEAA